MLGLGGGNGFGQLGDSTGVQKQTPVSVYYAKSHAVIASGYQHTIAIEASTGLARGWGAGGSGQIGNNNPGIAFYTPESVYGGRSYVQVACGDYFSLAIEASTGYVWAWGANGSGQVGDNSTQSRSTPVTVYRV